MMCWLTVKWFMSFLYYPVGWAVRPNGLEHALNLLGRTAQPTHLAFKLLLSQHVFWWLYYVVSNHDLLQKQSWLLLR